MNFSNISIKGLTTGMLLALGAVVVALSVMAVVHFRGAALEAQTQSLQRVIEVGVRQSLEKMAILAIDLSTYTKKSDGFNASVRQALKNSGDVAAVNQLEKVLDEQYKQRYVTSNLVDLAKIRIYDTNFTLVTQSNEGAMVSHLPRGLHSVVLDKVRPRQGADRLKQLGMTWSHNGKPYYSALLPVGGLRLIGYIEFVLRPQHNLRDVGTILQLPLSISSIAGDQLYVSKNWDSAQDKHSLPIEYVLKDEAGKPLLKLYALEDMSDMHESMFRTQVTVIGLFIGLIGVSLMLVLSILGKQLFKPAQELLTAIRQCAAGDLTVNVNRSGLKELYQLSDALADLVNRLRDQVGVISQDSEQLANAAVSLSGVTQDATDTIMTQRRETDQVATAINEMSATAVEVTNNAVTAADSAKQARDEAHKGQAIVTKTMDSIADVASEVEKAAEVIHKLQDETDSIGAVLDVIRGIAEQTNLLALNAAIEAARAGEQGRGFAVVADEVRTLASRTQESTEEIQNMIQRLQGGAQHAVTVMDESKRRTIASVEQASEAGQSLQTITNAVNDISEMNLQIANAAREQSSVADVINQNVSNITQLADRTSDGANALTNNSHELTEMAGHLKNLVSHFKV